MTYETYIGEAERRGSNKRAYKATDRGDRFHARGAGPRWPGAAGRRCRVRVVTWTVRDESARSRVLRDVTGDMHVVTELMESDQTSTIVAQCLGRNCTSNKEVFAGDDVRGKKVSTLLHTSYSERGEPHCQMVTGQDYQAQRVDEQMINGFPCTTRSGTWNRNNIG